MTDSNYSNIEVDVDGNTLDYVANEAAAAAEEYQLQVEAQERAQETLEQQDRQAVAEQEDPRNAENWGAKALIKEGQSILSGGLQDTASSIATFPERTIDALSGEMQQQREETGEYRPDFSPFGAYDKPIETRTWWGKQLRG